MISLTEAGLILVMICLLGLAGLTIYERDQINRAYKQCLIDIHPSEETDRAINRCFIEKLKRELSL